MCFRPATVCTHTYALHVGKTGMSCDVIDQIRLVSSYHPILETGNTTFIVCCSLAKSYPASKNTLSVMR